MEAYAVAVCITLFFSFVSCLRVPITLSPDTISSACHPRQQPHPRTLRSDQFTVLINGYSESRLPLLQSIAAAYSASSLVSSVQVLWGNPSTPPLTLLQLAHNLSESSRGNAAISLLPQPSSSLNARFLPRSTIRTRGVLVCDDDVEVDLKTLEFTFRMWMGNPDRLIGIFVRSHDIDMTGKKWIYTVHPDKYSIVLTKFMMMKREYLFKYSCDGGGPMREMRKMVDEMSNCEDILMNMVVAEETNAGPLMVGAERARDWGDPRNEDGDGEGGREVREVGLSSRRAEHRKRRGDCITEFHRVFGRMPLRFSYAKLVSWVGGCKCFGCQLWFSGSCTYPRNLKLESQDLVLCLPAKWSFNTHTVLKNSEQAPRAPIFTEEIIGGENGEVEAVQPPERSFWAKYWMYLIPLGLIVMNAITQAMNLPEEQATGQGAAQGQQSAAALQRGPSAALRRR